MNKIKPQPPRVEIDFTDAQLTGQGGLALVGQLGQRFALPQRLGELIRLKRRRRGASDAQMLWALISSLAAGNGALSDLDALREDTPTATLLGLDSVPSGRRLGEYLSRMSESQIEALQRLARELAGRVAPDVIAHQRATHGYVPVFVDGTAIEVEGRLFEQAGTGYDGTTQYWLHSVFVGGLWSSARLHPGGVDVARGWREQLEHDIAPLFDETTPVWVHADNAYYRKGFVELCQHYGWDYSISVTHDGFRRPVLEVVEGLSEQGWQPIGSGESATLVYYRPGSWTHEHAYVVVRGEHQGPQKTLIPHYSVILVSRDDLPLDELVARHRHKQGQENAFKGPLIDMDLHHPPCRRFHANQAFYQCGQIAQILLRALQYQLLPVSARHHGLRPLIRHAIRSVARLVHTGRRLRLDFAKTTHHLEWLLHASIQLE